VAFSAGGDGGRRPPELPAQSAHFFCERSGAARWRAERLLGYLIAGEWLHPKAQPRELSVDNPQLVFRVGFVEPVDQPDQRADVLLGLLKELVGGLGRHRTSGGRTATVGHDKPSLRTEIR